MFVIYALLLTLAFSANTGGKKKSTIKADDKKDVKGEKWTDKDIEAMEKVLKEYQEKYDKAMKDKDFAKKYDEAYKKISKEKGFSEWKRDSMRSILLQAGKQTDAIEKELEAVTKRLTQSEIVKKIPEIFGEADSDLASMLTLQITIDGMKQVISDIKNARKHFFAKPSFYVFLSGSIGLAVGIVLMMMQTTGDRSVVFLIMVVSGLVAMGGAVWMYLQRANKMFLYKSDALPSGSSIVPDANADASATTITIK
jgi:hypothetical protein